MSNEFWYGFGAGGVFATSVTLATAVVRGLWARRRAYRWGRGASLD